MCRTMLQVTAKELIKMWALLSKELGEGLCEFLALATVKDEDKKRETEKDTPHSPHPRRRG